MKHIRKRPAFTLVELLVVITIIGMLVALLLPSLSKASESSHRIVCLGQMRQTGVATSNMATDHRGWINGVDAPLEMNYPGYPNGVPWIYDVTNYWPVKITPYLGTPVNTSYYNFSLLIMDKGCPNFSSTSTPYHTSFGGNSQFVGWGYAPMHSLYEVRNSARIALVSEYNAWFWNTPYHLDTTNIGTATIPGLPRHKMEGLNAVYVDCHGGFVYTPRPEIGYAPWWDSYPGVGDWFPNAWAYGFLKE